MDRFKIQQSLNEKLRTKLDAYQIEKFWRL
jgi:hypothetical protein